MIKPGYNVQSTSSVKSNLIHGNRQNMINIYQYEVDSLGQIIEGTEQMLSGLRSTSKKGIIAITTKITYKVTLYQLTKAINSNLVIIKGNDRFVLSRVKIIP